LETLGPGLASRGSSILNFVVGPEILGPGDSRQTGLAQEWEIYWWQFVQIQHCVELPKVGCWITFWLNKHLPNTYAVTA